MRLWTGPATRRCLGLALGLLGLSACASAAQLKAGQVQAGQVQAGPITYEVRSWGQLMLRWQIDPDGKGEIWRRTEFKDTAEIRKFRLRLEGEGLRTFAAAAERARRAIRGGVPCTKLIHDLPYGTITWGHAGSAPRAAQEYRFDAGCRSAAADAVQAMLAAADAAVQTLAKIDPDPYIAEPAGAR